jgi:hypothetical protein
MLCKSGRPKLTICCADLLRARPRSTLISPQLASRTSACATTSVFNNAPIRESLRDVMRTFSAPYNAGRIMLAARLSLVLARLQRRRMPMRTLAASAGSLVMACVLMQPAFAKIYKFKDANGSITYSQRQCPANQSTAKVLSTSKTYGSRKDCIWPAQFAEDTARAMLGGADVHAAFGACGGVNAISKGSVNIIIYVHQFSRNENISAQRIRTLSTAKCRAGGFGTVACADLPPSYTAALGGCEGDPVKDAKEDPAKPSGQTPGQTAAGAPAPAKPQASRLIAPL